MEQNKQTYIQNAKDIFELVKADFDDFQQNFIIIGLDIKNGVIFKKILFKGGVDRGICDARIIFRELLNNRCSNYVICHNHPTRHLDPSREDIEATRKLIDCSNMLSIELFDHVIFSDTNYYSFKESRILETTQN